MTLSANDITNSRPTVRSLVDLVNHLRSLILGIVAKVITIDGKDGAGKSTVAKFLSSELGFSHVQLDHFLIKKQDHYVDYIRYDQLSAAIETGIKNNSGIIIDGVCVQAVLERIGIKPDVRIYVKRTDRLGFWYDEHHFDLTRTPEDIFVNDREELRRFAQLMGEPYVDSDRETLFHEIVRYHFKYRPHETADLYVELNHS